MRLDDDLLAVVRYGGALPITIQNMPEEQVGAIYGSGTIYSIFLAPKLTLAYSKGGNLVLTWPTGFAGLTLQSATNLISTAVWSPVVPAPVVVNGLETVTNQISGTKIFYRLSL